MARLNVYVPDDLAARARAAGLNVSRLTQDALRAALDAATTNAWLDEVAAGPPLPELAHDEVLRTLDEVRDEHGARTGD